jgi:hypothetical protein
MNSVPLQTNLTAPEISGATVELILEVFHETSRVSAASLSCHFERIRDLRDVSETASKTPFGGASATRTSSMRIRVCTKYTGERRCKPE